MKVFNGRNTDTLWFDIIKILKYNRHGVLLTSYNLKHNDKRNKDA